MLNKRWFRKLFPNKTFLKVNGKWINQKKYTYGKVTEVDGRWYTQAFCSCCRNELVHSKSFKEPKKNPNGILTYRYVCSFCGKQQYWTPDLIPGLLECNENGVPLPGKTECHSAQVCDFCNKPMTNIKTRTCDEHSINRRM